MARLETKYIVIHCSQTRPSQDIGAKDIDRWHRERGWLKIGYARVIKRDGTVQQGRADDELQAHVKDYNHVSTSVCVVGGAEEDNWKLPEDNFTAEQWESLKTVLEELVIKYPEARIVGHYELDERKTCPNFSVREYLLNEDIKDYKFADSIVTDGDIQEMKDAGEL
jgi:N-acetylmuramoyl-L-alanine amidase